MLHRLDDSPTHLLNSLDNFTKTTAAIVSSRINLVAIDHHQALAKLKVIENSIEAEAKVNFLLDGIV